MSIGILGNKIGMTQIFDEQGDVIPVTLVKSGPCYITQIKTRSECGYDAIQVGYLELNSNHKKVTKPQLGHFNKANLPPFRHIKEYRIENIQDYTVGQKISIDIFEIGQSVTVGALTVGKGNTSNIKRNNFGRGPMSHGSKHHRLQGSLGPGSTPGRVFPGKKMPGRMGSEHRKIKNLKIVDINHNNNIIAVRGSIPGKNGNLISLNSN